MATFNERGWQEFEKAIGGLWPNLFELIHGNMNEEQEAAIEDYENAAIYLMESYRTVGDAFKKETQY